MALVVLLVVESDETAKPKSPPFLELRRRKMKQLRQSGAVQSDN